MNGWIYQDPDSKVHEANMDPSEAERAQEGLIWPHQLWYLGSCLADGID